MKALVVSVQENSEDKWGERAIYRSKEGYLVLSTAPHTEIEFSGVILAGNDDTMSVGTYKSSFLKKDFKKVTETITIQFQP